MLRWLDLPAGRPSRWTCSSAALHRLAGRPGDLRALAQTGPGLVPRGRSRPGRRATAQEWDAYVEPLPSLHFPKPNYAVSLRRSALAAALHADAQWGAIASGFDRGPERLLLASRGHLGRRGVRPASATRDRPGGLPMARQGPGRHRPYAYWFQKYTIDGGPEWETPAVDQTADIPWAMERYYRRTGDLNFVAALADHRAAAAVACGASGIPASDGSRS